MPEGERLKKFVFSLERILAFKRTLYEKERNALAQLRAQRAALEQKKEDTIAQTLQLDAEFREKAQRGATIHDITSLNYHRENADLLVKQLNVDMATLDVAIEQQLKVVIQLDKDVKGLEKLRESQLEEYTAEAMKEEQERISELVSNKFIEDQEK